MYLRTLSFLLSSVGVFSLQGRVLLDLEVRLWSRLCVAVSKVCLCVVLVPVFFELAFTSTRFFCENLTTHEPASPAAMGIKSTLFL